MQLLIGLVENCGCVHPIQSLKKPAGTPFNEAVCKDLCVTVAYELIAVGAQPPAQIAVIVDLTILERDDRSVSAKERLPATFNVDYGETTHCHADRAVNIVTFPVRTASNHFIA